MLPPEQQALQPRIPCGTSSSVRSKPIRHHARCRLLHSILVDSSRYSRFEGEEMEAQRSEMAYPKSHRVWTQVSLIPSAVIITRLVRQS